MDNTLPIVRGIKAPIEVEGGASQVSPALFGYLRHGFQALGQEHPRRCMDGSHGDRSQHRARVVDARDDGLARLGLGPCVAKPIAPFVATVVVPSPWSPRLSRGFSAARCRTLAPKACQSDPASAPVAQTVSMLVSGMAGLPWVAVGTGKPVHCLPV
jgi:hypothetical protein